MNEADEEHHVAKLLIAEFDVMDGSEGRFGATFTVTPRTRTSIRST